MFAMLNHFRGIDWSMKTPILNRVFQKLYFLKFRWKKLNYKIYFWFVSKEKRRDTNSKIEQTNNGEREQWKVKWHSGKCIQWCRKVLRAKVPSDSKSSRATYGFWAWKVIKRWKLFGQDSLTATKLVSTVFQSDLD